METVPPWCRHHQTPLALAQNPGKAADPAEEAWAGRLTSGRLQHRLAMLEGAQAAPGWSCRASQGLRRVCPAGAVQVHWPCLRRAAQSPD